MFLKILSSLVLLSSIGFAKDIAADSYNKANELYDKRDIVDTEGKYTNILSAIEILKDAVRATDDNDLKFDINILLSRCSYWLAQHASEKNAKIALFQAAMDWAAQAKGLSDDYAEGYYYFGVALGRWAETNGISESLGRKDELMQSMKNSKIRTTRTDKKGETIDGMGPDRILGRVYYKLPFFAGGSRSESLKYLGNAYKLEPRYFLNGIYYAETLVDGGSTAEKATACQLFKDIGSKKPEDGLLNRIPENKEDIADAQKSFVKFCN